MRTASKVRRLAAAGLLALGLALAACVMVEGKAQSCSCEDIESEEGG